MTSAKPLIRQLALSLLGALILRFILMPLTLHGDLIFINYSPYFLSYEHIWDIYGHFKDHYLSATGSTYYPPLLYYIVAGFQYAFQLINPQFQEFMQHVHILSYSHQDAGLVDYLKPFSRLEIFTLIFWMKIPYLLADVGCVFMLSRIRDMGDRKKMINLWIWHPVLLFSIYTFGTFRIYSCLLLTIFIVLMQNRHLSWAMVVFGGIALMENYALFLLPMTIIVLGDDFKSRIRLTGVFCISFGALFVPLWIHSQGYVQYAYFSPVIMDVANRGVFRHSFPIVELAMKIILVASYLIVIVGTWNVKHVWRYSGISQAKMWMHGAMILLFVLYATSSISLHYFMWILPLWVILHADKAPWPRILSIGAIVILFIFNLDSRPLNLGLLAPLNPAYFTSLGSLHEWMAGFVPWGKVIAVCRLSFTIICLFFAYRLLITLPSERSAGSE